MTTPYVEEWGNGPRVVLVHGTLMNGPASWSRQRPLADRWRLVVPSRRGFVPNPPAPYSDYRVDAADVAALLEDGAHLVGHSFGGLVALLAASARAGAVRSLCLFEPATLSLGRGEPSVEAAIADHIERLESRTDPRDLFVAMTEALGGPGSGVPDPLPAPLAQHVQLLRGELDCPPWEASIPVDKVAAATFPKLVVTAGGNATMEHLADLTATAIGARRQVMVGTGHLAMRAPEANDALEQLWTSAQG